MPRSGTAGARAILRNATTVGAFTALSRVMGLAREMLQARVIGAGMEMIAAFGALIKSGPFPDAVKRAADTGNITRNEEFCNNTPDCKVRAKAAKKAPETEEPNARAVKIEVKKTPKGGKP